MCLLHLQLFPWYLCKAVISGSSQIASIPFPFNPTFLAHFLRNIFKCSEVVSIQLLSVSETCNDLLWYLWFSSFSVSVGLKVFRSLHWFTEASLLINLEMLFLFSSCLLRKLPLTSCDSYGSLIPHDLEILVVDDLILSNLMFKTYRGSVRPQLLSFNLRSKVCRYWLPLFQRSFTARGLWSGSSPEPSPESVIRLSSVLHIAWVLSVWKQVIQFNNAFSLYIGKCLHSSFINSSLCLLQMRAL